MKKRLLPIVSATQFLICLFLTVSIAAAASVSSDAVVTDMSAENEPFALDISYVDRQTCVSFIPTDEEIALLRQILAVQDTPGQQDITDIKTDGRVSLSIRIAPGKTLQPEVPLRFGLEIRPGMYADLLVWDSLSQRFSDILLVRNVGPEVEKSVYLKLLLPPNLLERLRGSAGQSQTFRIVSWMDGAGENPVYLSDLMLVQLPDRFETASEDETRTMLRGKSIDYSPGFDEGMPDPITDGYAGAGADAKAYVTFDSSGGRSGVGVHLRIAIFGNELELVGFEAEASAKPGKTEDVAHSNFQSDLRFLEKSLWSKDMPGPIQYADFIEYEKKQMLFKMVFTILVVPVTVEAGAFGEVGFQWDLGVIPESLYAQAGPYFGFGLYAKAAVSAVVAEAGMQGELDLVKDQFWGRAALDMTIIDNGRAMEGTLNYKVWNEISTLSGRIGPYVKVTMVGEKWWILVDWDGFSREDTLFDWSTSVVTRYE